MFKELLSLPVTLTIQTRVRTRQIILFCWTHVPCDVMIKRKIIPMRLSRNFFQGPGPTVRKQSGQRCLFVLFIYLFILQFTERIQWLHYIEN